MCCGQEYVLSRDPQRLLLAMGRHPATMPSTTAVRRSRAAYVGFPAVSAASPGAADMAARWPERQYLDPIRTSRSPVRGAEGEPTHTSAGSCRLSVFRRTSPSAELCSLPPSDGHGSGLTAGAARSGEPFSREGISSLARQERHKS
jgi:hypothetical protein